MSRRSYSGFRPLGVRWIGVEGRKTQGHACGRWDSCLLWEKGFLKAGVEDPTVYQDNDLISGIRRIDE
jgi:hypothetical protein